MIVLKIIAIGIGATLLVDLWGYVQSLFKIKSLDYRFVGRWIAGFHNGKFRHENIINSPPIRGELLLGWAAHYLIGITFSFLLIILFGTNWIDKPEIFSALLVGIITLLAPLFIMQPALGFGFGSSKLPNPNLRMFKSFMTHLIYGFGLYLSAILINQF